MSDVAWDALTLDQADDVAVALHDIAAGAIVRVKIGDSVRGVVARTDIPMAHKLALNEIPAGAPVHKYGEIIATAMAAIAPGDHVHVHNITTRRARPQR